MSYNTRTASMTQGTIWSRAALFAFLVSLNFEMINLVGSGESGLSVSRVTAVIYGLVLLGTMPLALPREARNFTRLLIALQLLLALVSIYNMGAGFTRIIDISFTSCAVIFVLQVCHQRIDPDVVTDGLLYFALGAVFIAVLGINGYGVDYDEDMRLTIFGDNPNVVGVRMAVATMILLDAALRLFRRSTWLSLALGAMSLSTALFMIETGSRVAALSLFAGLMVLYARYMLSRRRFIVGFGLMGILLAAGVPYLILSANLVLIDRLERSFYEGDLAGRGDVWGGYLSQLQDFGELIIGHGYSGFDRMSVFMFGGFMSPHNVFIEILILSGVGGLLLFVAMNLLALAGAIRQLRHGGRVLPLMLLMPYSGALLSAQTLNVKLMWVVLGICFVPLATRGPGPDQGRSWRAARFARAA